jgi:hypothetical protein
VQTKTVWPKICMYVCNVFEFLIHINHVDDLHTEFEEVRTGLEGVM